MNYLSVQSVSKTYGTKVLFKDISFGISQGQRVALVAKNGAGKSSLLKIITGKEIPDSGTLAIRKDIKIAYLDQDPLFDPEKTVLEVVFQSDSPITNVIKEYEAAIIEQMANDTPKNADRLQLAMEAMDTYKAWDFDTRIKQILGKLNIHNTALQIAKLSGGQKKRVALSAVLINEPDFLIMDEPTNHLDVDMIEWLEGYLLTRDMTLLLVTHDRYFLDQVCDQILEIDNSKLYRYDGNFSYYVEKKAERELNENSEIDKARNLYRRELEWIRKMPRARGTKAKARVDAFDDIEEKAAKKKTDDKLQLNVKMTRLGSKILELIKINKAFGDFPIMKNFSYIFKRNEKIGIVGANGVGKSTFLNIIMGTENYQTGTIETGETVVFGYYSQGGLLLNEDKRVIEVIKDIAEIIPLADGSRLSAADMLKRFQFPPDVQYNFVSKLSGGEKRKLYLLTVLMKNPNFLILDEPTNDLDIITLGILEDFLQEFQGCVLIVSHDRYFMDKLVDHIFVFEGAGKIRDFPGNYTQYRDKLLEEERSSKNTPVPDSADKAKPATVATLVTDNSSPKRKITFKEKYEFEQLEKEIAALENEKLVLTEKLNEPITDHQELLKLSASFEKVSTTLDEKTLRWLELSELAM